MKYTYKQPGFGARLRQLMLAAALVTGGTTAAQAQALNYPLANTQNVAGTYADLGTSGTVISTANNDDANSAEQLIGFNFAYNGATMDRFILNTNGFLKLGAAAGMTAPTVGLYTAYAEFNSGGTLLGTGANDINLLSPFNYDLADGTSTAEYRMTITGTAPSRVCTIQWKNVADKAQAATAGGATILTQYANMSFQVKLYEANGAIEFVFAGVTPAPVANNAFKYAQMGIKGSGNGANQILRVTKGSASPWGDAAVTFASGPVTTGATGAFNFRQAVPPDNGRTFRFLPSFPNDAGIGQLYTINQLVAPNAAAHTVQAVVLNNGTSTLFNLSVTLNVTGANTFTNTQTIALAPGVAITVTFAPYTPTNQGTNVVAVSVPNDDNNSNNTKTETQVVNPTTYSYISPGVGGTSAVGYPSGSEQGFAAKFQVGATRVVTGVRAFIYDAAAIPPNQKTTVGETLYGVVVNPTTGAIIGRSANFVVTAADINAIHTFALTSPVTVPAGDLLVGMMQISPASNGTATYFPMGVQNETPTRVGAFYRITATSSAPVDIAAGTGSNVKYLLEAVTIAPSTCSQPSAINITGTATTATVSFTGQPNGTGYQIVYGAAGFNPATGGTTTATFTGTNSTVSGLTASTCYDFYVRTICSPTDQSALAGPFNFCTSCTPPTISAFPYNQNFDQVAAGQTLPCGITVLDSNNDGFTWQDRATVDPSLATGNISRSNPKAIVYSYNNVGPTPTIGADDWFFTPALTLANTQRYRVSFYYRTAGQGLTERLEVKYGPAATPAGQTTTIYTNNSIGNTIYLNATNTTTPVVADIVATGNYFVGFHAISTANQGFLAVDDLTISAGPLATSEALKRAVSVFPNPSNTGQFNLEIHGANAASLAVEVTNMLGQRVYTGTAKDNLRTTLDLSGLTSGIYTLKVRNGQEFTQQQISIVK